MTSSRFGHFTRRWRNGWAHAWGGIGVKLAGLVAALLVLAGCVATGRYGAAVGAAGGAGAVVYALYRHQTRLRREVGQFADAVRYRDFSRYFTPEHTPPDVRAVRDDFNRIIGTFKTISRERETQHHYLQNVLELVDTGIFSYDLATGVVLWANDTLKQQLRLPTLKSLKGLAFRYPELAESLRARPPGERVVLTVQPDTAPLKLLFSASVFQADGARYKLIACQNISAALDENEAHAWQRLLRVMTHELMNSVAPIASLADTLQASLAAATDGTTDGATDAPAEASTETSTQVATELLDDLRLGIDTIKRRSAGLLRFATTYRNLSKVAVPELRPVPLGEVFAALHRLMQPTLREKGTTLTLHLLDPTLTVAADPSLLEQVLLNLLLNALDAVTGVPDPRITLSATLLDATPPPTRRVAVQLRDNGVGMPPDVLDSIFVPFFTTKQTGSGIGLSLSKQIMLLHRGSIQVQSAPGRGTVVTLEF